MLCVTLKKQVQKKILTNTIQNICLRIYRKTYRIQLKLLKFIDYDPSETSSWGCADLLRQLLRGKGIYAWYYAKTVGLEFCAYFICKTRLYQQKTKLQFLYNILEGVWDSNINYKSYQFFICWRSHIFALLFWILHHR